MKNILLLPFLLLASIGFNTALRAQDGNVQYKVTRDAPDDICNLWVFVDPFQVEFPFQNFDGWSMNVGTQAMGFVGNRLGFDFTTRVGLLSFGKLSNKEAARSFQLEAGGMLVLKNRMRVKSKTQVILSQKESTNVSGDRVTTTKFIIIPAKQVIRTYARGGLYIKRNAYIDENKELDTDFTGNLTCVGLYVGLGRMAISNVYLNTSTDGKARRSGAFRLYADALICPVRKLSPYTNSPTLPTDYKLIGGPIGFRFGIWGMPVEDREHQKKKAFSAGVDFGIRPGDGLFATGSIMFPILRKKSTALGYQAPAPPQTEKE